MDVVDNLAVRFHFLGDFINDGKQVHYIGGSEAMSYIERDKVSLPEVIGHLKDHCTVGEGSLLHWLFPGKNLTNGLRVLVDDKTCQFMSDCILDCGVADVFVEHIVQVASAERKEKSGTDYVEIEETDVSNDAIEVVGIRNVDSTSTMIQNREVDEDNSDDSDFLPGDDSTSEVDEEAIEILKKFKEYKKIARQTRLQTWMMLIALGNSLDTMIKR